MGPTTWSRGTTQPLLLELARALRARMSLPGIQEGRPHVQHAARVWARAAAHAPPLDLEVCDQGFQLGSAPQLCGPGLSSLAHALHDLGVRHLHVDPALEPRELEAFIDWAAQGVAGQGLAEALRLARVDHLHIDVEAPRDVDGDGRAASRALGRLAARMADAVTPREPPVLPRSAHTEAVLEQLAALELCSDAASYEEALARLDGALSEIREEREGQADAYRAAVVFGRHASRGAGRSAEIRELARGRARHLVLEDPPLLNLVLQQAHSGAAASARPAVQILTALGAEVMPSLIEAHAHRSADLGDRTPEVLLAMGEHLVPAVVDELSSASPARARRGAELLGATQHPRGVSFLTDQLHHADPGVRREVARALARIGTRRALRALVEALRDPDVVEYAAQGLGESGSKLALAALAELAGDDGAATALRGHAIRALGRLGDTECVPLLELVLGTRGLLRKSRLRPLRLLSAEALYRIGGPRARVALEAFADDPDRSVRAVCREYLRSLRT